MKAGAKHGVSRLSRALAILATPDTEHDKKALSKNSFSTSDPPPPQPRNNAAMIVGSLWRGHGSAAGDNGCPDLEIKRL
jgi:hypothetical protein